MNQIARRHPMLVSMRGHRVPLTVVMVQQGDFRLAQAVLRAEADLSAGTRRSSKRRVSLTSLRSETAK